MYSLEMKKTLMRIVGLYTTTKTTRTQISVGCLHDDAKSKKMAKGVTQNEKK
jgi:hypothetical protein